MSISRRLSGPTIAYSKEHQCVKEMVKGESSSIHDQLESNMHVTLDISLCITLQNTSTHKLYRNINSLRPQVLTHVLTERIICGTSVIPSIEMVMQ